MERIRFGGRRIVGFGVGDPPPSTYVLGKQQIPHDAPTGTIVKESTGSTYDTTCTKQADGTWTCSNGSVFAVGDLERRGGLTCKPGEVVAGRWGLCVPPDGLTLANNDVVMPDGSVKKPDGTLINSWGVVSLSLKQQLADTAAAIEQTLAHPLDTAAIGAQEIGRGTGTIVSNTAEGAITGLVNPTGPKGEPKPATWPYWLGAAAAVAVGAAIVVPVVREVIATRQYGRRTAPEPEPT